MKSKGVTTQMKALDGYFLMVDWCSHCCRTELMFLQTYMAVKGLKVDTTKQTCHTGSSLII